MAKLVGLLMSLCLIEFGAASIIKAPSPSTGYKPSLYSQPSPELVSNTSPEAAQNRPSHTGHLGPKPGSNMREADGGTRTSSYLNSNGKLAIAIALSLKINGVDLIRGCAEEKITEKPMSSSPEIHSVGDQYIPVEQSVPSEPTFESGYKTQNSNNHDSIISPIAASEVTTENSPTINMDTFLEDDPGVPDIVG